MSPQDGDECHHNQGDADNKGIQAMEPFQKNLEIHLAPGKEGAEAQGPVRTGQPCLHHPRCSTDDDESDQGDDEVSRQKSQTPTDRRHA